jgi:hypothetical protein
LSDRAAVQACMGTASIAIYARSTCDRPWPFVSFSSF